MMDIHTDFTKFKKSLSTLKFGKYLPDSIYVHRDCFEKENNDLVEIVENIKSNIDQNIDYNILKFFKTEFRLSFLYYPYFSSNPHPELASSLTINLKNGKIRRYDYTKSENPPILHRKESFIASDHPLRNKFMALTAQEEAEGLYSNTKIIGFKKNWERLLEKKKLSYEGHKLIKAKTRSDSKQKERDKIDVKRHKTAIIRYDFSKPIKTIIEYNLLSEKKTLFDYGCGQGDDLRALNSVGIKAQGWDPVHLPQTQKQKADIVNLGFVINTIEDEVERAEVLQDAFNLSKALLVVSCMLTNSTVEKQGTPYKDGIITNRGTFQKYYYQSELRQYIEDVLEASPVAVSPGIFYIFKNPQDHQEFLSRRIKSKIDWDKLSVELYPEKAERKRLRRIELYDKNPDLLNSFWNKMVELGRIPTETEFSRYPEIYEKIGNPKRARKIFIDKFGEKTLAKMFELKRDDLIVYIALSNFSRRVPFTHLPKSLQIDIKTFIGPYNKAYDEGRKLLFSAGNPAFIEKLCDETPFGFFDHKALYIHNNLIDKLHPILRIYIGCAEVLYGNLHDSDIIKIHKKSGKVTLLKYDNFGKKALPELVERIKIDLPKQRIDTFDHQAGPFQQLLYFKERYVAKDHPKRKQWEKFSNKLSKAVFDENSDIGFGPSKQDYLALLEKKGLTKSLNPKK